MAQEQPLSARKQLSKLHVEKRKRRPPELSQEGKDLVNWLESLPTDVVIMSERPEN